MKKYAIPLGRPTGRPLFLLAALLLVSSLLQLNEASLTQSHPTVGYSVCLFLAIASALVWLRFIIGRMVDLRISRIWAIPYVLGLAAFVFVLFQRHPVATGVSALLVLAVQGPLMVLPGRPPAEPSLRE
jgi:hypothetical protein